jgi:hypothetical protein
VLNWDRSEFVLEVAGLRENYPRLEIGDLAHLRMIFEEAKTGSGRAFEARINSLRKREGLVRALSLSPSESVCRYLTAFVLSSLQTCIVLRSSLTSNNSFSQHIPHRQKTDS